MFDPPEHDRPELFPDCAVTLFVCAKVNAIELLSIETGDSDVIDRFENIRKRSAPETATEFEVEFPVMTRKELPIVWSVSLH
jgi:hypothetical protein